MGTAYLNKPHERPAHIELDSGPPIHAYLRSLVGSRYDRPMFVVLSTEDADGENGSTRLPICITSIEVEYAKVDQPVPELGISVGGSDCLPFYHMKGWLYDTHGRTVPRILAVELDVFLGLGRNRRRSPEDRLNVQVWLSEGLAGAG